MAEQLGWFVRLKEEGGREGLCTIGASTLGVGVGLLGLPILTIGLFMVSLHHAFGWNRAQIAGASTCINLATVLAAPFVGRLCDRVGVRPVALTSLCSLVVGFACLSAMSGSLITYYLIWLLLAAGGVGTGGIVWTRAIGTYYRVNRGFALGLAMTGTAFAALLAPLTLGPLIHDLGWRAGYAALSLISLVTIPITFRLFSERRPDGRANPATNVLSHGQSLGEALGSATFWKLGIGFFLLILGMGSCLVHFVPLAVDFGLPLVVAQRLFSVVGVSMLIGRILIGRFLDRFNPLAVAGVSLAIPAIGCLVLLFVAPAAPVFAVAAATFGFSAGAEVDILAFLVARYFGLRSYGAIYGSLMVFFATGSGAGSILTGYARDVSGSYRPALAAGVLVFLLGAFLVSSIRDKRILFAGSVDVIQEGQA